MPPSIRKSNKTTPIINFLLFIMLPHFLYLIFRLTANYYSPLFLFWDTSCNTTWHPYIYIHISITEEYYYLIIYYSPYFFFIVYHITYFLYLVRSPYGEFTPLHEDFAYAQPGPLRTEPTRRPFFATYSLPKKEYQSARLCGQLIWR